MIVKLFALLALPALSGVGAGAQTDSLYMEMDSTTLVTRRHTSAIKTVSGGVTQISLSQIQSMPKILGSTDPVNFIKNLPGVQTSSEYDSGIHIQGCDNAHNDISLAGVPIYGANHLFGFFSVFNPSHYTKMSFSRSARSNRLGGTLKMELSDTLRHPVSGEVSIGIMSSQGTIGFRCGRKSHLRLSARQSYMNLLYKKWLMIEISPIRYGFGDYNVSWLFTPTPDDRIWLEGYWGQDNANIAEKSFNIGLGVDWGNHAGAVHWEHKGRTTKQHHTLYASGFRSDGLMTQNESSLTLRSRMNTYGYKGSLLWNGFTFGAEAAFHDVMPQTPSSEGLYGIDGHIQERQHGLETSFHAGYEAVLADRWTVEADLKGSLYVSPEKKAFRGLSPQASVTYNMYRCGKLTASYGWRHQYLFQTGLSNIGLPVEFWFLAGKHSIPQASQQAGISYEAGLLQDALALSVSIYGKRLYNQVEYKGDMFDFFNSVYDLDDHLLKGDGWNYGLDVMLHKQTGSLTGWISYSLGRALRRFDNPDYTGIYPASHERIHELNAVCAYKVGKWDFSGTFVYAGGAPFTAPEYYYISSGQMITRSGEHNACRMRPYARLDLSVTYSFRKDERQENGINMSLYNVTARRNDVMYRLNIRDGVYSYGPMSFFLRLVPSISYFHKF